VILLLPSRGSVWGDARVNVLFRGVYMSLLLSIPPIPLELGE